MSYPHSYLRKFTINGVEFSHYHAQDGHGTVSDVYTIDQKISERDEFMAAIQKAVGDAEYYITQACGLNKLRTPDWSMN